MHTKRISLGKGKKPKWITTPRPGRHKRDECIPLRNLVRDILGFADTAREADAIINNGDVIVDKKPRKDPRFAVGLMDVVEIPKIGKFYRVLPNKKGLYLREIDKKEVNLKPCKITKKVVISKEKMQLGFHDGTTLLINNEDAKKFKIRDTIVFELPEMKIHSSLNLKEGNIGLVTHGIHAGYSSEISEITESTQMKKSITKIGEIQTLTDYIFVIGEKKPLISIE